MAAGSGLVAPDEEKPEDESEALMQHSETAVTDASVPIAAGAICCTECGSEAATKVSHAYESGTSSMETGGVSYSLGSGDIGLSAHPGSVSSNVAQRLAPPERKNGFGFAIAMTIASPITAPVILWLPFVIATEMFGLGTTAAIIGGAVLYLLYLCGQYAKASANVTYNREQYPSDLELWQRSWLCTRCGAVFQVM